MHMHSLNWLAILVAAAASMILGFLWYWPLLFAKAWLRHQRQSENERNAQERRACLRWLFLRQPSQRFHTRSDSSRNARGVAALWHDGQLPHLARLCGYGTIHRRSVRQTKHEAVCHQHRIPTRLLSGDGSHLSALEIARARSLYVDDPFWSLPLPAKTGCTFVLAAPHPCTIDAFRPLL